jgi:mercuric ion transport protein
MDDSLANNPIEIDEKEANTAKTGFLAAGGIFGALAASSCCVLPLVLTVFGVSGAWMSNLRAMTPYQPYFIAMTIIVIGYGFYAAYWKPTQVCAVDASCAQPLPSRIVRTGLWIGAVLVLIALTFPYWFEFILPYLP